MDKQIITRHTLQSQAVFLPAKTGVEYCDDLGDWAVWLLGEIIGYAGGQQAAWNQLNEAHRVRREHTQRNPANG